MALRRRRTRTSPVQNIHEIEIDNPLARRSNEEIQKYADHFSSRIFGDERTPEQRDLFTKAARIAKDGWNQDWVSDQDKKVFAQEIRRKFWSQPKPLIVTVITLCFSAIIQGWLQTGTNGANLDWPRSLNVTELYQQCDPYNFPVPWVLYSNGTLGQNVTQAEERCIQLTSNTTRGTTSYDFTQGTRGLWIYAGVNAITFFAASLFGCWLSDPLHSKYLGRRGAIFISALICLAGVIGAAFTRNWQQLLVCRLIIGLGMGAKASVTPIFGAEVSPSHLRGGLVMNWQLFDAFGLFAGYTANLIVSNVYYTLRWRLQIASSALPLICLLTLMYTIPESPRWLLKQGRVREAYYAMRLLRESDLQAATQLLYANAQLRMEVEYHPKKERGLESPAISIDERLMNDFTNAVKSSNYWRRLRQLFEDPRTKRATVAAAVVMLGQQLCGINIIAFYGSTFFRDANGASNADRQALFFAWGTGLANFIFTLPAYWLIDKKGRRFLLFATYPGMMLSMFAASMSYLTPGPDTPPPTTRTALVIVFIFIFTFFYAAGQGPVAFAYSSEVFPLSNREAGMSFAVFVNLFGAGLLTLLIPLAGPNHDQQAKLLGVFTAFNIVSLLLIFFFVPETALAVKAANDDHQDYISLEELNYIFGVPTADHLEYQVRIWLPWAVRYAKFRTANWFRYSDRSNIQIPQELELENRYLWYRRREREREEMQEQTSDFESAAGDAVPVGNGHADMHYCAHCGSHEVYRASRSQDQDR